MWPASYFAPRYWNGRYWLKVGATLNFETVDMGPLYVMEQLDRELSVMETDEHTLSVMETMSADFNLKID